MTTATDVAAVPKPVAVGEKMRALDRFFRDVTWTGTIHEGGMGPGTPLMRATGRGTHEQIQEGRWFVGSYEQDQTLEDGTPVLRWELHWVVGWDPVAGRYRATLADNYGRAGVMNGHIDGDRLIFESEGDAPPRLRLTWDASDPDDIAWRNEMALEGEDWFLVEEYHMTPVRGD